MDENHYQYFLSQEEYRHLLAESEHIRLVRRLARLRSARRTGWSVRLLMNLADWMIDYGLRLRARLCETRSLSPCDGNAPQVSYGESL